MFRKLFKTVNEKPCAGKLCECTGDITTKNNKECEYFPLRGGYHTAFLVGDCNKCGGLSGFPHHKLQLAVNEGSEEGREILAQLGLKLS